MRAHRRGAAPLPETTSTARRPATQVIATVRIEGEDSFRMRLIVTDITETHIKLSGKDLPISRHQSVELELCDELLRMRVSMVVEAKNAFGITGRLVSPSNLFRHWIADAGTSKK